MAKTRKNKNVEEGWIVFHEYGTQWFKELDKAEEFVQELMLCSDIDSIHEYVKILPGYRMKTKQTEA